jgi:hypothetical protein
MQPSQQQLDMLSNEPRVCLELFCRQFLYWNAKASAWE